MMYEFYDHLIRDSREHAPRDLVWKPGRRFASVAAAASRNNL